MRKMAIFLAVSLLLLPMILRANVGGTQGGVYFREDASLLRIGNTYLELVFRKDNGAIWSVINKGTGIDLKREKEDAWPVTWGITLYTDTRQELYSDSNRTESFSYKIENIKNGKRLRLIWTNLFLESGGRYRARITGTVTVYDNDPLTYWEISGQNYGTASIYSITYPFVAGIQWLGRESSDDYMVFPSEEGRLFKNIWGKMKDEGCGQSYPSGFCTMQFNAFYDANEGGFYLATYDTDGYIKDYEFFHHGEFIAWSVTHYSIQMQDDDFFVPYPIVVGVFDGDWMVAADIYKEWAYNQWWCAQRLREKDTPNWLKETTASNQFTCHENEPSDRSFTEFALVTVSHGSELGTPNLGELWGWEKYGIWAGYGDYFPPYEGWEAFDEMISELHRTDSRLRVFIGHDAMHLYTDVWENENPEEYCVHTKEGEPLIENTPIGLLARMCISTEYWQNKLESFVLTLAHHQVDMVQLDGLPYVPPAPCYSPEHGHALGFTDNWYSEAWLETLQRIRAEAKTIYSDITLATEGIAEIFIPYIDSYHLRDVWVEVGEEEVREEKAEVIPLFSYVYHDYIIPIGHYNLWLSPEENPEYHLLAIARMLNWGKLPSYNFQEELRDPSLDRNAFGLIKEIASARRTYAQNYLVYGRMLKSPEIESPTIVIPFEWPNISFQKEVSALQHSVWRAPNGNVGYFFVNIAQEAVSFNLTIDTATCGFPEGDKLSIRLLRDGDTERVWKNVSLPMDLELSIDPNQLLSILVEKEYRIYLPLIMKNLPINPIEKVR